MLNRIQQLVVAVAGLAIGASSFATPVTEQERAAKIDSMYRTYRVAFRGVEGITATELMSVDPEQPPVLVDVRPADERAVSVLPGAVTKAEYEAHPERYVGRDVVTYCTIGARSGTYASKLRKKGISVRNLEGSLLAWTHAGGPLVTPGGEPTHRVHVYGKRWNLVAPGYEAVIGGPDAQIVLPPAVTP